MSIYSINMFSYVYRNCVKNSKSTIDDIETIFKLLNDNEILAKDQASKTIVLIVLNEITSIIISNDVSSTDKVPEGF